MQTLLSRKWWVFLIRGLLAIAFGFLALVWPGQTILSLVILFGIYSLIDGFLAVIASIASARFRIGWWAILAEGLVGIVLGVTVLAWPDVTAYAVVVIIGIWALATGLAEFIGAISLRRVISGEFW
ncbi:MAG: DUF308 domain-containing protein, partial [Chloroflexi bacterium]|nr:DUF308 domain-containing protein [Chloroflexota bacterium]